MCNQIKSNKANQYTSVIRMKRESRVNGIHTFTHGITNTQFNRDHSQVNFGPLRTKSVHVAIVPNIQVHDLSFKKIHHQVILKIDSTDYVFKFYLNVILMTQTLDQIINRIVFSINLRQLLVKKTKTGRIQLKFTEII